MSQETIETATDEEILGLPPAEEAQADPEPEAVETPPDTRVPLDDLISERRARQNLEQELHALRIATLQGVSAPEPREDPVDAALAKIAKRAGWDEAVTSVLGPSLRPVIEELAYLRELNEKALGEIGQQRQHIERLSERDRLASQNNELSRLIPDLDKIGPKMLELLKDLPPEAQKMYAANPTMLLPLAKAVRTSNGVEAPKPKVNKAQLSVDTGAAPSQPLSADVATLMNMNPNSKEFEAVRRNFYGEG